MIKESPTTARGTSYTGAGGTYPEAAQAAAVREAAIAGSMVGGVVGVVEAAGSNIVAVAGAVRAEAEAVAVVVVGVETEEEASGAFVIPLSKVWMALRSSAENKFDIIGNTKYEKSLSIYIRNSSASRNLIVVYSK